VRPLIAVPAYPIKAGRVEGWVHPAVGVPAPYLEALQRAGAQEAVLMPVPRDTAEAKELLVRFDGLLLIGGGDLDPERYGQARQEKVYGVATIRDEFELALARAALDQQLPTLAICRGHQVLNVVLGGTLDQHITDRPNGLGHGRPGVAGGTQLHEVELVPGSHVADAMGVTTVRVSSQHHQAIDKLGDGLRVTARAADGVIEAVELEGDQWVVSVQWHPEDTAAADPAQQRLFDTFVAMATGRR
jgi:putative glutamine amidotransferase